MSFRPDLSRVNVLIKTFMRDPHLFNTVQSIERTLPEVKMIIVDDGYHTAVKSALYHRLSLSGHRIIELPFDSGFGAKSNAAISFAQERPYLLIGSDDFDFAPEFVRKGIERLTDVLDADVEHVIASGRVNNYPYEGWLIDDGARVTERYIKFDDEHFTEHGTSYHYCHLTVNYSLIRSSILGFGHRQVHWDDDVKIGGGEHGAFFIDVLRSQCGHVCYVPGVNITEQQNIPTDVRYQNFRGRARKPERPCFAKRGIKEYVLFGGTVEQS